MHLLIVALLGVGALSPSQSPRPPWRPCPASWNSPLPAAKKKDRYGKPREAESARCLELSAGALELQEYLQAYAREKHWTLVDDQVSEDTWRFSFSLTPEQLRSMTRQGNNAPAVKWRGGMALLQVVSTPADAGFTRTVLRAYFRAYGESADQFAMQQEYWKLPSNGSLEDSLLAALKAFPGERRFADPAR